MKVSSSGSLGTSGREGMRMMFLCPHHLWVQKIQKNSITADNVRVSALPLSGKKPRAITKVTLYEPPKVLTGNIPQLETQSVSLCCR